MDDDHASCRCISILLAALGVFVGSAVNDGIWKARLVECGLAEYSQSTGEWLLKVPPPIDAGQEDSPL